MFNRTDMAAFRGGLSVNGRTPGWRPPVALSRLEAATATGWPQTLPGPHQVFQSQLIEPHEAETPAGRGDDVEVLIR